ncbi:hybrid sensor histidine kinase/response regulator [Planosporangium mesophilum]|uniref:histidine kinase n=1 Tax=Planosporangium mesophilum TaxID=689768 RepID=A0A8J3WYB6_9ACTN|nr:PAS domain-containing hybrid sensor histidine kinase/response regulator [Planosporangium mesophilum]NJC81340.1 PAS domain S-box protein [Planosporangium mesophilum]GII21007.1 histidine kinase [Planosporangium mesophilum]
MAECSNGQSRRFGYAGSVAGDDAGAGTDAGRDCAPPQHALLAAIVRSSHDAIVSMTLDGVVTSWNRSAEELFGYPAAEMIGRHVGVLWPENRGTEQDAVIASVRVGKRVERYRTWRLRRDGTAIEVGITPSPITDDSGAVVGIAAVCRSVSERERAQARYRGLLEEAPDAIVGINANGVIVICNAATERTFGYRRDDLIGQPVELLVPEAARELHIRHRAEYMAHPQLRPLAGHSQLTARRADGTLFPVDISLSWVETDDGVLAAAAVRDVTERLEAEAERDRLKAQAERQRLEGRLQQAQRLESLGQLAGGVAHDFNNLLAVIVNYAAFVSEEIEMAAVADPDRWHSVARDMQQIQRATERGIGLTHQLLAFGRREVVRPRVLSLNAVVSDVKELLIRSIGEHVQLLTELSTGLWPVKADPGQIEQVLVNLAVNARDAMLGGGILTIGTRNMIVGNEAGLPAGRYVAIRVEDTGTGMPREVIGRAFEPFFTTKPKGEGTGLGLATVYGIVRQAGGDVQIASEPGVGTTFTVLLPATDEAPAELEAPVVVGIPSGGGETVLVVEDEPAIREVARRILRRGGYEVLMTESPLDALDVARAHDGRIHLLMTDVVMPKMLGKDVAERVRALRPDVKVIFMSGYARPVLASSGTLEPGVTLLEKPFSEAELLQTVRQVLDGC